MIEEYDPNIRWSRHDFEITYMVWDYKTTAKVSVGGNCRGSTLFSSAIDEHYRQLYEQQGDFPQLMLTKSDGRQCMTPIADEQDLHEMCVSIQLVGREETK